MKLIWCILYCPGHLLGEMIFACENVLTKDVLSDAFIPTFDRVRKYQGAWHTEQRPLLPDCIFLECQNKEKLLEQLEQYKPGCTSAFEVLSETEEKLLRTLWDDRHHLEMSVGYIENGCTHITTGPLQGKEKYIRKIDRHKRLARLEFPLEASKREIYAGLEIKSKS